MEKFVAGETAYLENGERVEVIDATGETYVVVAPVYDGEDGPETGEPLVALRIFREPPCPLLHAEAQRMTVIVAELKAKIAALRDEGRQLEKAKAEIPQMIAKHAAIARVIDHIEGRTTHFVVSDWCAVDIFTAEKALDPGDERDRNMGHRKLLTLYGTKGAGLDWRLNGYRDGSSSRNDFCIPCASEDEAKAELARILGEQIAEIVKLGHAHRLSKPIANADKYGVPVADDVRAMAHAWEVKEASEALDMAEKGAAAARARLQALTPESVEGGQ